MKLRYKINLMVVGWCSFSAILQSIEGNLGFAIISGLLAWLNWECAVHGEKQ